MNRELGKTHRKS